MKKILFMMMCCLLMIISAGCSKDDSEKQVTVNFQLQNEDGVECYDFHEGENIIFRLEIKNNTDENAVLPAIYDIMGNDIFHVYSKNGEDIGIPWDELYTNDLPRYIIGAHSSAVKICPWFDIPSLALNGHEYSDCFYKKDEKAPLPKGEYYSKFDIKLDNKIVTCNRTFKIR